MSIDNRPSTFKRGGTAALLVGAALAVLLTAAPAGAETLRWARSSDALTMDPHSQNEGPTSTLLHHIYETLVSRDNDGSLQPRLATEWRIHPDDPTIWEFKLREGVTFHDGAVFNAEDVVFSLNRVREDTSDFKGLHAVVESVSAVDDYTVHVKTAGPSPLWIQNLTNTFMIDKGWAEANGVTSPTDHKGGQESHAVRNTNGTGQYVLVSRDPEVKTVLKLNENHWGEKLAVTDIEYVTISEAATRVAALLSGEVDLVQDVPVQDIARLETTDGITVTTGPENRNIFFAYDMSSEKLKTANVDNNPFANPMVREAMALALDRDAIQKVVMRGQSQPSAAPLPPFVNGWSEELHQYGAPDYEKASALVKEAGYPDGFSVDLNCPNDRYINDEGICQAFVGMLGRIGITANLVSQSKSLHFPLIQNRQTDFYLLGWGVPTFDSQYVFDFLVHSTVDKRGGWNGSMYSNADVDAMIQSLATETDLEKRDATIAAIWKQVQEDRVFLNVHNQLLAYAMRDGINLPVHPENQPKMTSVTFK